MSFEHYYNTDMLRDLARLPDDKRKAWMPKQPPRKRKKRKGARRK